MNQRRQYGKRTFGKSLFIVALIAMGPILTSPPQASCLWAQTPPAEVMLSNKLSPALRPDGRSDGRPADAGAQGTGHAALPATVSASGHPSAGAVDCLLVCPAGYLPAMKPWLSHRQSQGHKFAIITSPPTAEELRHSIRDIATRHPLRYVLLVGDAPTSAGSGGEATRNPTIPVALRPARIVTRYGSEPLIATDNWFADINDDDLPDLAIGRWTVDNAQEVSSLVEKTLRYERSADLGLWRRRVNFVAGIGGFGATSDYVIEATAKKLITDGIPAQYTTHMTYASWRSPFAPDPRQFRHEVVRCLNDGCLAWIYMGHGNADELDRFRLPQGDLPILSVDDARLIACREGAPIAAFLSCYAGAFDFPSDCLAEELLRAEQGPVAVIGGSRVTMPYAMAVWGQSLMHELFTNRQPTLGDVFRQAKIALAAEPGRPADQLVDSESPAADSNQPAPGESQRQLARSRGLVDGLARLLSPNAADLRLERIEHVFLFNLLGDPLLRIDYPELAVFPLPEYGEAGSLLEISGTSPVDGPCLVELVCRRDRHTFEVPRRNEFEPTREKLAEMTEVWRRVNDQRWNATTTQVTAGRFQTSLRVPTQARGPSHVRVFVQGDKSVAMGASDIYLRAPATP